MENLGCPVAEIERAFGAVGEGRERLRDGKWQWNISGRVEDAEGNRSNVAGSTCHANCESLLSAPLFL
jgi:hypothetical protein